jgi:hypothetical protein
MSKNKFEIFNTFYLECHLALPSGFYKGETMFQDMLSLQAER